jgi:rhodanese-related sulfurtransferase
VILLSILRPTVTPFFRKMPISQKAKPPPGSKSINEILSEARSHLKRITAQSLYDEIQSSDPIWGPTHVIDIRPAAQRAGEGSFTLKTSPKQDSDVRSYPINTKIAHQVHIIERNVLEWRLDPQSDSRIKEIIDAYAYETRIVITCSEGYTSSLAARELQRLGLRNATDLEGGYWAWKASVPWSD